MYNMFPIFNQTQLKIYGVFKDISRELWHTSENIREHACYLLPSIFDNLQTCLCMENYRTLYVVVYMNQWLTVFHKRNMNHYRRATTGDRPVYMARCIE